MSKYVVLLYRDEEAVARLTDAEGREILAAHREFRRKHGDAVGIGRGLQFVASARSVQVGDRSMAVTDGPFVETKEALGGLYVIEAPDLDAAIAIAADVPGPHAGVEVRPVLVLS